MLQVASNRHFKLTLPPVVTLPSGTSPFMMTPAGNGSFCFTPIAADALLPGQYTAEIAFAEIMPSQTGRCLRLRWRLLRGAHKHREPKQNIYFEHTDPTSEKIGERQLESLLSAIGLADDSKDVRRLLGKRAQITVGLINHDEPIVLAVKPLGSVN